MRYVDLVNVLMGTDSIPSFSRGNTAPLATHPFGMASFGIETRDSMFSLFFHPDDHTTTGVRLTHLPSPWIADYAFLTVMPQTGKKADVTPACKSGYRRWETDMHPYGISMNFLRYRNHLDMAPTMRGGAFDVTWQQPEEVHRLAINFGRHVATAKIDYENRKLYGTVSTYVWPVPSNFKMFFVLECDRAFDRENLVVGTSEGHSVDGTDEFRSDKLVVNLAFEPDGRNDLHFTIATSFISFEQAEQNAKAELDGKSVLELQQAAADAWDDKLSRIEIDPVDDDQLRTFYSCLYRTMQFPRTFYEYDAQGNMVHYSPADGEVYPGPMYTDNGFFDTYMTVYPLFSLIMKDEYAEMCEGFLNYYRESGWLPRWMSPSALDSMPGTFIDQVFADAVAKGIVTDRKTIEVMFEAMDKHANIKGDEPRYGRDGIEEYLKYHYITSPYRESVNKTLNYAYGDFSIAVIARHLGMMDEYHKYMQRSQYYRNLFDPETTFMRARDEHGNMREDWTQFDWGGDYTEGGPWQNSFTVPHDTLGLASLFGGREALVKKLDQLFNTPPHYHSHWYGTEIHEMTEMAAVDFGQCALSNQPSFHIPYLYTMMGKPDKTSYWVRRAVRELFHHKVGFPGDEDNGSMSGWYVFSAMGLYPSCPSVPEYVLGSPAVKRCVIHTHEGTDFTIEAINNDHDKIYWQNPSLNGQPYDKVYFNHEDIMKGGTFRLYMTPYPAKLKYNEDAVGYSVSKKAEK